MDKLLCIDCRLIPREHVQRLLSSEVCIVSNKAFCFIYPGGDLLIRAKEPKKLPCIFAIVSIMRFNENINLRLLLLLSRYGHYVEGTGSVLQTAVDVQVRTCRLTFENDLF